MPKGWADFFKVIAAGAVVTLGEAAGRFGWFGLHSGLPFPPEQLSQAFFASIPLPLFSLGIRFFGFGAKWIAFVLTSFIWSVAVGTILFGFLRTIFRTFKTPLRHLASSWRRLIILTSAAGLTLVVIEGAWLWIDPPAFGYVPVDTSGGRWLGPGCVPLVLAYTAAAFLLLPRSVLAKAYTVETLTKEVDQQ